MRCAIIVLVALGACRSGSPVGPARFANAPAVWRVNDRLDVPEKPREVKFLRWFYDFDAYYQAAVRGIRIERTTRALGVNALDEVPDSTWFINRIGMRELTPEQIRTGPAQGESPELHVPWTIKSSKIGGTAPGLICEDSSGVKFLLKFDMPGIPETETAADAIVGRLMWAAGWQVPTDYVVYFNRSDLVLGKGAYSKVGDRKRPLTVADVEGLIAQVAGIDTTRIRGLASIYLPGVPIGGATRDGIRPDDPNDLIAHERRRDQRGFRTFAAWLGHNDLKFDNTLDTWQEDPADPKRHYLVHYQIDFGKALGGMAKINRRAFADYTYRFDLEEMLTSLFSFGVHRQPWEGRIDPELHGVGLYSAEDYHPAKFKPNSMSHLPVLLADRFDAFWASKIMIQFSRPQIVAAVEAGRLSDPRAAAYLVETIVTRQRFTARYWFRQVLPIDSITLEPVGTAGPRLCFTDLATRFNLEQDTPLYTLDSLTPSGRSLGTRTTTSKPGQVGRACVDDLPVARDGDGYTVVRITSSREIPPLFVHLAVDSATGLQRVIGLDRR